MLVDYASSDSDVEGFPCNGVKRKRSTSDKPILTTQPSAKLPDQKRQRSIAPPNDKALPPLPDSFCNLYATNVRTSTTDDPNLHEGRQRGVAHVDGNWPSHVYLEWYPSPIETKVLEAIIVRSSENGTTSKVHSFLKSDLGVQQPLHISLSAPVILKTEQRDGYLDMIHKLIRERYNVGPISVKFKEPSWACNRDATRWFLALPLHKPENNGLNRLLNICNTVANHYNIPELYPEQKPATNRTSVGKDTSQIPDLSSHFHVSIGWALVAPSEQEVSGDLSPSTRALMLYEYEQVCKMMVTFQIVKVKVGNVITSLDLNVTREDKSQHWLGG